MVRLMPRSSQRTKGLKRSQLGDTKPSFSEFASVKMGVDRTITAERAQCADYDSQVALVRAQWPGCHRLRGSLWRSRVFVAPGEVSDWPMPKCVVLDCRDSRCKCAT